MRSNLKPASTVDGKSRRAANANLKPASPISKGKSAGKMKEGGRSKRSRKM